MTEKRSYAAGLRLSHNQSGRIGSWLPAWLNCQASSILASAHQKLLGEIMFICTPSHLFDIAFISFLAGIGITISSFLGIVSFSIYVNKKRKN
ncbi:MAG: hypothetical protein KGJ07_00155 [Patescibacteria group bacterium]|nr:hypothetical protein [Patescibacteria group bacterium]